MKPNPCKRCGKEPVMGNHSQRKKWITCQHSDCVGLLYISGNEEEIVPGWNAMNPLPKSDKCGPMTVDEAEFAKGITKQADVIEKLRESDCPVEGQEPELVEESCCNCRFMVGGICCRYPQYVIPKVDTYWCGEWRAKK